MEHAAYLALEGANLTAILATALVAKITLHLRMKSIQSNPGGPAGRWDTPATFVGLASLCAATVATSLMLALHGDSWVIVALWMGCAFTQAMATASNIRIAALVDELKRLRRERS